MYTKHQTLHSSKNARKSHSYSYVYVMYVCMSVSVFVQARENEREHKTVNPVSFSGIPPADVVENQNPAGLSHNPVHSQLKKKKSNRLKC